MSSQRTIPYKIGETRACKVCGRGFLIERRNRYNVVCGPVCKRALIQSKAPHVAFNVGPQQPRPKISTDDIIFRELMMLHNNGKCPQCANKVYRLNGRKTYTCGSGKHHFTPLAGTILEKSATNLTLWFYAIKLVGAGETNTSELQRELGTTYKTAWRMHQLIRTLGPHHPYWRLARELV